MDVMVQLSMAMSSGSTKRVHHWQVRRVIPTLPRGTHVKIMTPTFKVDKHLFLDHLIRHSSFVTTPGVSLTNTGYWTNGADEDTMRKLVYEHGAVITGIDASQPWSQYKGGVFAGKAFSA